jgi:integrase
MKQRTLSTVQYPTKAKALAALAPLLLKINGHEGYAEQQKPTFGLVIDRFIETERLHEIKAQSPGEAQGDGLRYSTALSYLSVIQKHIRPAWGEVLVEEMKPLLVQDWLKGLTASHRVKGKKQMRTAPMAGKTKAHIKQLIHRLFEKAMLWGFAPLARNPIDLVELRGVTRRQKRPLILTPDEYEKVQARLPQPYQTMVAVAMCLGLRVSEVLGLKWSDFDFDALTVTVQRGVVHGRIADTKTEASTDELPLDPAFAELLKEWRTKAPESEAGWVFASYDGKPFHAAPIQQDYFRPAGYAVGLKGELGWHTFRHSYRSMLDASGAPIGVQQKLMRHAQVSTTMNVYGSAYMEGKREAHSKVVQMVLPRANEKAAIGVAAS